MKRVVLVALVAVTAAQEGPVVETVRVRKQDLVRTVRQPGSILPFEESTLVAAVSGYVKEVFVRDGDWVERGAPLAALSVPFLAEEIAGAEAKERAALASVAAAEADALAARATIRTQEAARQGAQENADLRRLKRNRLVELQKRRAATAMELDDANGQVAIALALLARAVAAIGEAKASATAADARVASAKARLGVARAERARIDAMKGYAVVRCPLAKGLVKRRLVDTGSWAEAGRTQLFVVQDVELVRVRVDLDERDAVFVEAGSAIRISPDALPHERKEARVTRVSWSLDATTRTMRTETDLDNRSHVYRAGMFVHAEVDVYRRIGALTLPARTLVAEGGRTFVYVVEKGRARRVPVAIGLDNGIVVEITQGLQEGAEVVIAGWQRIGKSGSVRARPRADER